MTAVAVWDHPPTPTELLDARLARGWEPTVTDTVDGPRVLGYAACLTENTDTSAEPSAKTSADAERLSSRDP